MSSTIAYQRLSPNLSSKKYLTFKPLCKHFATRSHPWWQHPSRPRCTQPQIDKSTSTNQVHHQVHRRQPSAPGPLQSVALQSLSHMREDNLDTTERREWATLGYFGILWDTLGPRKYSDRLLKYGLRTLNLYTSLYIHLIYYIRFENH